MNRIFVVFNSILSERNGPNHPQPVPGAIGAINRLLEMGYDVWAVVAITDPGRSRHFGAMSDWLVHHLPALSRKLVATPDIGLLGTSGDFLCDGESSMPHGSFDGTRLALSSRFTWQQAVAYFERLRSADRNLKQVDAASAGEPIVSGPAAGSWVASFGLNPERPVIATVKDAYILDGERLIDAVLYRNDGSIIGRSSPPCNGPMDFEPALPADDWTPIEEPNFDLLADHPRSWGCFLVRLNESAEWGEAK